MDQLTDQQLADIQAREAAATLGPWFADGHEILVGTADDITRGSMWIGETCTTELPDWGAANAEFVAHARTDVPALVAEVRRLRAVERAVREQVRDATVSLETLHDQLVFDNPDAADALQAITDRLNRRA